MPGELGIASQHLPVPLENMRLSAPFLRKGIARMSNGGLVGGSEFLARVASRFFDDDRSASADGFNRDPAMFGYVLLGPLLAGFSDWLHREATMQGIERLGFLTREGPLIRSAYEAMYPDEHLPTLTVVGSRRIVQGISLTTEAEIDAAVVRFGSAYSGGIGDFLKTHFGLPRAVIDIEALRAAGFESTDSRVTPETRTGNLRNVVLSHADLIRARSSQAREKLEQYLDEIGLSDGRTGLVDIGYSGQMQAAYSRLAGVDLAGFYLATFRKSAELLGDLPALAYLAERVAPDDRRHGICRHRQIYETLLCAPGPTFVGVEKEAEGWRGIPDERARTPVRDAFVSEAHKGALAFVSELSADRVTEGRFSPLAATGLLDSALDDPTPKLAEWIGALEFDDSFALEEVETLIDRKNSPSRSVWSEGAAVLSPNSSSFRRVRRRRRWQPIGPYGILGWRHALAPIVAPIIARIGDAKDADHFRDDPIGFFRRLSDPRYRRIGRLLYPWD